MIVHTTVFKKKKKSVIFKLIYFECVMIVKLKLKNEA